VGVSFGSRKAEMSSLILAAFLLVQALEEARALAACGELESAKTVLEQAVAKSPTAPSRSSLSSRS
jgi:hypothetical protein